MRSKSEFHAHGIASAKKRPVPLKYSLLDESEIAISRFSLTETKQKMQIAIKKSKTTLLRVRYFFHHAKACFSLVIGVVRSSSIQINSKMAEFAFISSLSKRSC